MKRYLVFSYDDCYPSGGIGDLDDFVETIEEARAIKVKQLKEYERVDIFDVVTGEGTE